jgi:hypothetical protein
MAKADRMMDKAAEFEVQAKYATDEVTATFSRERAAELRRWAESEKRAAS